MTMRGMWRVIGVLFFLVATLGGWILWLQNIPEPIEPSLSDLDPQTIQNIVVERPDDKMIFTRQTQGWIMTKPFRARADTYHIEQVTALPRQTSHARYQIDSNQLAQFELSPPRITVWLDDTEFRFGMQNPIDFRRYVQVNGGPVHLIDDTLMTLLNAPATSWIDSKLLPPSAIQTLDLPDWHVSLSEKGAWTSKPEADEKALRELVNAWRNARAIQISPFTGKVPPQSPVIKIQLEDATIELILLQQEPELILLRPDLKLRYHFYGEIGRKLLGPKKAAVDSPDA